MSVAWNKGTGITTGPIGDSLAGKVGPLKDKARDLNRDGDWGPQALEVNTAVARLNPSDVAARTRQARCLRVAGDLDGAKVAYEGALELDPDNANILQAIQEILDEAREKRAAEEASERELAHGEAVLENLEHCDEALVFARRMRQASPLDLEYTVWIYRRALELDEGRLGIAVEMAALIRRSGSSARALRIYERILEASPDYDAALVGKAAALLDTSRIGESLEICNSVLGRTLDEPYARKVKARAHALLGEREESLWQWEQASG